MKQLNGLNDIYIKAIKIENGVIIMEFKSEQKTTSLFSKTNLKFKIYENKIKKNMNIDVILV
uniref:Uncharacterized protein n=1 Tax=viral metagenome TaxID=1070528 RepID=A0A6M3X6I1_9ZZZZ